MSCPTSSATTSSDLIERARNGDQQAWQVLFDDCYPKIRRVIRRRMSRPLRSLYDSTDIANEVMKSLPPSLTAWMLIPSVGSART